MKEKRERSFDFTTTGQRRRRDVVQKKRYTHTQSPKTGQSVDE